MKIGLLSDTHSVLPNEYVSFFADCDEIWHAGDIGNYDIIHRLRCLHPVKAVYGNIDDIKIRAEFPEYLLFEVEQIKVLIIHIGGYPGKYQRKVKQLIQEHQPKLFISGHSHILKIMNDPHNNLLHINPGAAGRSGFHKKRTMIRFDLNQGNVSNLELLEL